MSTVPVSPRRVFGVDFSAARDAGEHIWVCRAHPGRDGIRVESVDPLSELPGGAVDRDAALASLGQKIVESPRSAWGLDFCFALPRALLTELAPAVAAYPEQINVVAGFGDPDRMREACVAAAPGAELRRRTDEEAATPFSPYNLRIHKQTYYGMTHVLRPLLGRPDVAVLPFEHLPAAATEDSERLPFHRAATGPAPHIYVAEVCPASVLARLEYPKRGYKGNGSANAAARAAILRRLMDEGLVRPMARALRSRMLDDPAGDGLDSLLAAVGAWRATRDYDHAALRADACYALEGFVYT